MRLLPADKLVLLPNRQRREFDPAQLSDLGESIKTNQLFHPLTTRVSTPADACPAGSTILVSGERRLRAIQEYIWQVGDGYSYAGQLVAEGLVPCTDLGELDPLAAEEAECEENIRRVDLTVPERCIATERIFNLRNAQASARGEPPVTVAKIAEEVRGTSKGDAQTRTRNEILLARHMHDPEIRAVKSVKEGMKLLKRKEQTQRNVTLAAQVGKSLTAASHTLLNEDALVWLESAPDAKWDVILTDQPFGMGADEFGDSGGKATGAHFYKDDEEVFDACLAGLIKHSIRITKPQAHLYWFCDIDKFQKGRACFEHAGWWVHRTPLIWHKPNGSRIPWPEHGPQRKYELILYAVKGKRPVTKAGFPDVISLSADENLGHQAQKPVALYRELLRRSVKPGDQVLDPFGGTGPLIPAAHELKCFATVIERDPAAYGIAAARTQHLTETDDLLEKL